MARTNGDGVVPDAGPLVWLPDHHGAVQGAGEQGEGLPDSAIVGNHLIPPHSSWNANIQTNYGYLINMNAHIPNTVLKMGVQSVQR